MERSLPLIQKGAATWRERQRCGPCHQHPLMLRAMAMAQRHGFAIDAELLKAEIAGFEGPPQGRFQGQQRTVAMKAALASEAGVVALVNMEIPLPPPAARAQRLGRLTRGVVRRAAVKR